MSNLKLTNSPAFEVRLAGDAVELDIMDYIGDGMMSSGVTAKAVRDALKPHKSAKSISVTINSPGGSAWDGIGIYNLLKQHKGSVNVRVVGLAASAASIIAMAGDEIEMDEGAFIMIHNASTIAFGTSKEMDEMSAFLTKLDGELADIYAARTGGDAATIKEQMDDETWLTAEEAVADGFATSVIKAKSKAAACFDPSFLKLMNNAPGDVAERFFNPKKEDKPMATDTKVDAQNVADVQAKLDTASQEIETLKASVKSEKDRVTAIAEKFGKHDPEFAIKSIVDGDSVERAAINFADKAIETINSQGEELAKAKKKSDADADGERPLALQGAGDESEPKDDDHKKIQAIIKAKNLKGIAARAYVNSIGKDPADFDITD